MASTLRAMASALLVMAFILRSPEELVLGAVHV